MLKKPNNLLALQNDSDEAKKSIYFQKERRYLFTISDQLWREHIDFSHQSALNGEMKQKIFTINFQHGEK
jgi:hypothetical protein